MSKKINKVQQRKVELELKRKAKARQNAFRTLAGRMETRAASPYDTLCRQDHYDYDQLVDLLGLPERIVTKY